MESVIRTSDILLDFYRETFDDDKSKIDIEKCCIAEIDSLYRHLFRGNENKKERIEIIRAWSQGEKYKDFINKCSIKKSIFFKSPEKIFKHYNFTTLLERTLVKLLTK
jgi:trimethylamine:corrinoid methyltransferase-like protein